MHSTLSCLPSRAYDNAKSGTNTGILAFCLASSINIGLKTCSQYKIVVLYRVNPSLKANWKTYPAPYLITVFC